MQPGTIIDERFVIEESIERGGFGQVYRAYDMQEEIVVAVKVNEETWVNRKETQILKLLMKKQLNGKFAFAPFRLSSNVRNPSYWHMMTGFPKYYQSGTVQVGEKQKDYIAMQILKRSVKDIIKTRKNVFSTKSVCQIGINMLHRLEDLHKLGLLHLDIKPDNIMVEPRLPRAASVIPSRNRSSAQVTNGAIGEAAKILTEGIAAQTTGNNCENNQLKTQEKGILAQRSPIEPGTTTQNEGVPQPQGAQLNINPIYLNQITNDTDQTNLQTPRSKIYLIDFGIARRYLENDGKTHVKMRTDEEFNGNLIFCSKHMFMEITQSRRDDLISLGYLLIFLFNGQVPWIKKSDVPLKNQYNYISNFKQKMKPKDICTERAKVLVPYFKYTDSLAFEEEPDYGLLRHLLVKILLDKDLVPDQIYDWDIAKKEKSGNQRRGTIQETKNATNLQQYYISNMSSTHLLENDRVVDEHLDQESMMLVKKVKREDHEHNKKTLRTLKQSDRQEPKEQDSQSPVIIIESLMGEGKDDDKSDFHHSNFQHFRQYSAKSAHKIQAFSKSQHLENLDNQKAQQNKSGDQLDLFNKLSINSNNFNNHIGAFKSQNLEQQLHKMNLINNFDKYRHNPDQSMSQWSSQRLGLRNSNLNNFMKQNNRLDGRLTPDQGSLTHQDLKFQVNTNLKQVLSTPNQGKHAQTVSFQMPKRTGQIMNEEFKGGQNHPGPGTVNAGRVHSLSPSITIEESQQEGDKYHQKQLINRKMMLLLLKNKQKSMTYEKSQPILREQSIEYNNLRIQQIMRSPFREGNNSSNLRPQLSGQESHCVGNSKHPMRMQDSILNQKSRIFDSHKESCQQNREAKFQRQAVDSSQSSFNSLIRTPGAQAGVSAFGGLSKNSHQINKPSWASDQSNSSKHLNNLPFKAHPIEKRNLSLFKQQIVEESGDFESQRISLIKNSPQKQSFYQRQSHAHSSKDEEDQTPHLGGKAHMIESFSLEESKEANMIDANKQFQQSNLNNIRYHSQNRAIQRHNKEIDVKSGNFLKINPAKDDQLDFQNHHRVQKLKTFKDADQSKNMELSFGQRSANHPFKTENQYNEQKDEKDQGSSMKLLQVKKFSKLLPSSSYFQAMPRPPSSTSQIQGYIQKDSELEDHREPERALTFYDDEENEQKRNQKKQNNNIFSFQDKHKQEKSNDLLQEEIIKLQQCATAEKKIKAAQNFTLNRQH